MDEEGKQILFGEESEMTLDYNSYADFIKKVRKGWSLDRITIIASPTKAIVVPCIPEYTPRSERHAGILITKKPTFKL